MLAPGPSSAGVCSRRWVIWGHQDKACPRLQVVAVPAAPFPRPPLWCWCSCPQAELFSGRHLPDPRARRQYPYFYRAVQCLAQGLGYRKLQGPTPSRAADHVLCRVQERGPGSWVWPPRGGLRQGPEGAPVPAPQPCAPGPRAPLTLPSPLPSPGPAVLPDAPEAPRPACLPAPATGPGAGRAQAEAVHVLAQH